MPPSHADDDGTWVGIEEKAIGCPRYNSGIEECLDSIESPVPRPPDHQNGEKSTCTNDHEQEPRLGRLAAVISRLSSTTAEIGPPPDGGFSAWLTCICAHLVFCNTWGFVNSFGIFQTYYAEFLAPASPSTISWIGSVQVFLAFFLSVLSGRISDAGHFRLCYWVGTIFQVVGIFGASASKTYWQLMLSQGICVGFGAGFLCCPIMSVVATFFSSRRSLAIGIVTCGNVSGGLVFPAMARQLLPSIGFAWTMRAIGFMELGMLVVIGFVVRVRERPKATGPMIDFRAFFDLEYSLYIVGMFFNIAGTFINFYYVASFGRTGIKNPFSYPDSLNLLLIFNGVGLIGRLGGAFMADHVGPLNLIYPCAFAGAIFCFTWIAVNDRSGVYAWTSLYAVSAGGIQALFPAGLGSLTKDVGKMGQRLGMGFTVISFSVLVGPPVAGAMVTTMNGSYLGAQVYSACLLICGCLAIMTVKVIRIRRSNTKWFSKI